MLLKHYDADGTADIGAFSDAAFRALIQKQDDADVPMDNRSFIVPPSLRNAIMGIDRYTSTDFVNGKGVETGKIGNLYGVDVYVSTNVPTLESGVRGAQLIHKDTNCSCRAASCTFTDSVQAGVPWYFVHC